MSLGHKYIVFTMYEKMELVKVIQTISNMANALQTDLDQILQV